MNRFGKYGKFLTYLVLVVLINLAGLTLFTRIDLTRHHVYSLSKESRDVVATLKEPLTLKVFFTKNLPAPYNGIERYLHDMLDEYAEAGNQYFNYKFYDVSTKEGESTPESQTNQKLAQDYGITPVQIRNIEQDQVKFQKAYMGIVLIHGDIVEKIPAITSTDGLEYKITSTIRKMNSKISTFLALDGKVQIKLFLSSSLNRVAGAMRMNDLSSVPEKLKKTVEDLNGKYYGKLEFVSLDPSTDSKAGEQAKAHNLLSLKWPAFRDPRTGMQEEAGSGIAGILVQYKDKAQKIPLIVAERIPLIGTQYRLSDVSKLGDSISGVVDSVVDINEKIGYLTDHGTVPLSSFAGMGQQQSTPALTNLQKLLSDTYSINRVQMKESGIPDDINCLIIAGPTEPFSEYELFQIDQFLMKGKSVALFLDPFREIKMQHSQYQFNQQGPVYIPNHTGLEKLLSHYGLSVQDAIVLDEKCYKQKMPQAYGGGEKPIYFAPIIQTAGINESLPFMENIKQLVSVKAAPLELKKDTLKEHGLKVETIFSSSPKSWLMKGQINLNPMFIHPPTETGQMKSYPLAVLVSGKFSSYFAGKPAPVKPAKAEKPAPDKKKKGKKAKKKEANPAGNISESGTVISTGAPGKLLLIGTSEILKDNVIDKEGNSPNATFAMNIIDALNNRVETAKLRSKIQQFNPLKESSAAVKTTVKVLNIAGLPVLVILFGLLVLWRRKVRKRRIQWMFSSGKKE
jgi:ABC-2 type transport system permease protein